MKHLASLNPFFWKYRYRFSLGIIFILLTNYFRILAPQLTGYIVNLVVRSSSFSSSKPSSSINKFEYDILVQWIISALQSQSFSHKVAWCSLLLLLIALISGFFMFLMRQTIIVMSRLIEFSQKKPGL